MADKPWRRAAPAQRSGASENDQKAADASAKVLPSDPDPVAEDAPQAKPAKRPAAPVTTAPATQADKE